MAQVSKFEDLEVWKTARLLTRLVYDISNHNGLSKDFALRDQLRRSASSIMANIAEGFERNGDREFGHFLAIAKGSCGELRAQLYIALDQKYVTETQFQSAYEMAVKISKMLSSLMGYLRRSELRGSKFKDDQTAKTLDVRP